MGKYLPLGQFLSTQITDRVVMSIDDVSRLVGQLPPSAYRHPAWWANNARSHPWARAWLDLGRRAHVDLRLRRVTFARASNGAGVTVPVRVANVPRGPKPTATSRRMAGEIRDRIDAVKSDFPRYLEIYDRDVPFRRAGQLEFHLETILSRRKLAKASAAAQSSAFVRLLICTLQAWGIGRRGSRLVTLEAFQAALLPYVSELDSLDRYRLWMLDDEEVRVIETRLFKLVSSIPVVENRGRVVALTKTLHHLLPDLVVPIDGAWTGAIFGWSPSYFGSRQLEIFHEGFVAFAEIARAVSPQDYVGQGWRSSPTKLIDNAVVGFCLAHHLGPSASGRKSTAGEW